MTIKTKHSIPYGIFCWTDTAEQRPAQLQGQLLKRWVVIHISTMLVIGQWQFSPFGKCIQESAEMSNISLAMI